MKTLHISKDLKLPVESTTQKFAWLGVTGSGKTYGASKFSEDLWDVGAQFVVLDPVGVWYGLRLAKDGKKPSHINIPIFGGLHGDVPLEPTGGQLLANLIVDKGLSCIIDVSQFEHDTDKSKFAADFADRFFFRKKASSSAIHLLLEEAQEFIPQNPQRGEERMLHAFIRIQKLGRNFGIGTSILSQRPQEVNKKALNMCQTLFVFRTTGTHERTAIEKWIEDKSLDENIAQDLPKIPTGSCHVWSPEFLKVSEMIHISEKMTFNASATPEVGEVAKARHLAPIDLDKVRTEMAATIEKAKSEDPKFLKKKIFELEGELKKKTASVPQTSIIDPKVIDRAVQVGVQKAVMEKEREYDKERTEMIRQTSNFLHILKSIGETIAKANLDKFTFSKKVTDKQMVKMSEIKINNFPMKPFLNSNIQEENTFLKGTTTQYDDQKPLSKCAKSILSYLESVSGSKTKTQLWVATGYAPGGGFNNCLYELTGGDLILKDDENKFYAKTKVMGKVFDTSLEKWFPKVSLCARKIFQLLLQDTNTAIDKDQIAAQTGYATGGGFNNCIYELTGPELIKKVDGGYIINSEILDL